ncbi:hypothetical protein [Streptomyces sp. NPDC091209]
MKAVDVRAFGDPLVIHEARSVASVASVDDSIGEARPRIVLVLGAGR